MLAALAALGGIGESAVRHASDLLWTDGSADARVVVVAVDEASVAARGEWPWSDDVQASLLRMISAAGPAVVAVDIVASASDVAVAEALSSGPFVAAQDFSAASTFRSRWLQVSGGSTLPQAVLANATGVGHAVVLADSDGVLRSLPAFVETSDGEFVPALAVRTVDALDGVIDPVIVRPSAVQVGAETIPVESDSALRIHWTDDTAIVSAEDVLAGAVDDQLRNAIVVLGVTEGGVGDRHITPLQPGVTTPGVIVQAQAISTILQNAWVVPYWPWVTGVAVLVFGLPVAFAARRLHLWWAVLVAFGSILIVTAVGLVLFQLFGWLPDFVRIPIGILAAGVVSLGVRAIAEQRDRQTAERLFSRYVPRDVALALLREGRGEGAGAGERLTVGILFCDLRSFTPMAASLDPGDVQRVLDIFYDYVCERVFAHEGTVMQFVGDEVFSVFGAPRILEDPIRDAREASSNLLVDLPSLAASLDAAGLPRIEFGMGLHAGLVVASHVGPADRRQYSVIGDPINVGSRLCGLARGGQVVASEEAAGSAEWLHGSRETVLVKGIDRPLSVIRVQATNVSP
ncbi:CHASE2 domain-containing protein [Cryobacterium psychrophilum]|uniref:CHASE2 domain-containing protein n=1 Tax=Cryobacterium psychrophilum TaxID=41988 RepID=UPI001417069B|nr:adenylate/guanylate cyclase domain-containing protein [Cryobacterium psychrophilum]